MIDGQDIADMAKKIERAMISQLSPKQIEAIANCHSEMKQIESALSSAGVKCSKTNVDYFFGFVDMTVFDYGHDSLCQSLFVAIQYYENGDKHPEDAAHASISEARIWRPVVGGKNDGKIARYTFEGSLDDGDATIFIKATDSREELVASVLQAHAEFPSIRPPLRPGKAHLKWMKENNHPVPKRFYEPKGATREWIRGKEA